MIGFASMHLFQPKALEMDENGHLRVHADDSQFVLTVSFGHGLEGLDDIHRWLENARQAVAEAIRKRDAAKAA